MEGNGETGRRRRGRGTSAEGEENGGASARSVHLPPIKDSAAEGRRRRSRVAPEVEPSSTVNDGGASSAASAEGVAAAGRRGRKSKASAASVSAGTETQGEGNGMNDGGGGFGASTQGAYVPVKDEEFWDLVLIVDVQTTDETEAKRELDCLLGLLRREGLQISRRELLDESEGACGRVMCLCTASQSELEQEAEIMAISKSLKIPRDVAERFNKDVSYGRVTAPFSRAKKGDFHEVPFIDDADNILMRGDGPDQDKSGLVYFSPCERQALLEHIIESKIREAVHMKMLSPLTKIQFFPLHDDDGDGNRDVTWLRANWVGLFRKERWMSLLGIWQNPHQGTNEPISVLREYFGDQITMYFAFLSFYTRWLVYPAVVGFIFQIWLWSERGFDLTPPVELRTNVTNVTSYANSTMYERVVVVVTGESSDWGLVVYCIFICVWSALFIKFWERKQNALAYYWFTSELSLEEKVRREFYIRLDEIDDNPPTFLEITAEQAAKMVSGAEDGFSNIDNSAQVALEPSNVRKRNVKTGQLEEKFPKKRRMLIYLGSISSIAFLLCCVGIIFVYFYLINVISTYMGCSAGALVGSTVHSILIILTSMVYRNLATMLNDLENHRTDVKYENSLIFKVFIFEFINNFLAMFWIAFLDQYLCDDMQALEASMADVSPEQSCVAQSLDSTRACGDIARENLLAALQTKIGTLIITRMIFSNFMEVALPAFQSWKARRNQSTGVTLEDDSARRNQSTGVTLEDDSAVAVAGEGFGHPNEGCEEEEEVRVWVGGGGFGFGKKKKKEEDEAGEETGAGVDAKEEGGVDAKEEGGVGDKLEGGVEKKVSFTGGKDSADDKGASDVDPGEGSGAQTPAADKPTKADKNKPVIGKKLKDARKAETIRVLQECKPKSRDWWMCKGRAEEALETYGDGGDACTLDDYNEIVIQFSFVVLFGVAFPITGLLALLSNLVEICVDATKLCYHMRRPLAQRASSIPGTWLNIMRAVAVLSIITNIVILFQNSTSIKILLGITDGTDGESTDLWLAAFVLEHIIILTLVWFLFSVPNEPKSITKLKNLSKLIQRSTLIYGKEHEHAPMNDDGVQTQGQGVLSPIVEAGEGGGGGARRRKGGKEGPHTAEDDGLAALAASNDDLSRKQMAAAAEERVKAATSRGSSRGARAAAKLDA